MIEPAQRRTVAVIGAGVVGAATACALAARDWRVWLLDPQEPGTGTSEGNAGHIGTEQHATLANFSNILGSPRLLFLAGGPVDVRFERPLLLAAWFARFIWASRPRNAARGQQALGGLAMRAAGDWRALLASAGAPQLLHLDGHDEIREGPRAARATARRVRELAAIGIESRPGELFAPVPDAARATVLHVAGSGHVANSLAVTRALVAAMLARGGRYQAAAALALEPRPDGVRVTSTAEEVLVERVVVACGVRSATLLRPFGLTVPLLAERGYSLSIRAPGPWPFTRPQVYDDRSLVVTPMDFGLRATSFVEFGVPDLSPDLRKIAWLKRQVAELGLVPPGAELRAWSGCRPTLPDYLPAIGCLPQAPAVAYAFGHQHLGLTLAASTATLLAEVMGGGDPATLAPFRIERFRGWGPDPSQNGQYRTADWLD
jgi:glycine/D-amino acid oxidase-like deaminating enzyme